MSGIGELATILRVWRDRLAPVQAGLPVNAPRRTRLETVPVLRPHS
jgi:hypothetical protein